MIAIFCFFGLVSFIIGVIVGVGIGFYIAKVAVKDIIGERG